MNVGLLYICAFAGMLMMLGSLLLLWKGRIVFDSVKGEISEVELPLGFKIKTQQPILVMFLFGSFLLAMPIYMVKGRLNGIPRIAISGQVQNNVGLRTLQAYAVIDDKNVTSEVKFYLPQLEDISYHIIYRDPENFVFVFDELVDVNQAADGTLRLQVFDVTNLPVAAAKQPQQVAAAVVPVVNPADVVKEDPSLVKKYK